MRSTVTSAPGKALLTGGYLVTERPNAGAVLTLDARFYAVIRSRPAAFAKDKISVTSVSPQFQNSERTYHYSWNPHPQLEPDHGNPFVEIGLLYGLAIVQERVGTARFLEIAGGDLSITLLADNSFYSQQEHLTDGKKLADLPRFQVSSVSIDKMKKTGLGSSAALVTSLCAALLQHFGVVDVNSKHGRETLHRVAQLCHCLAQNSIGSGFDVASAVFGTQLYTRFDPACLPLPPLEQARKGVTSASAIWAALHSPTWNAVHMPLRLPRGVRLLLGDVNEGSKTPGMVRLVQKWKAGHTTPEALAKSPWAALQGLNESFANTLHALTQIDDSDTYRTGLHKAARSTADGWGTTGVVGQFAALRNQFVAIRGALRQMGKEAGDGNSFIEPAEQTALADATMGLTGVLLAGVPGAGGKDAIIALVLSKEAEARVRHLWQNRTVVPLDVGADARGVRMHPLSAVPDHLLPSIKPAARL